MKSRFILSLQLLVFQPAPPKPTLTAVPATGKAATYNLKSVSGVPWEGGMLWERDRQRAGVWQPHYPPSPSTGTLVSAGGTWCGMSSGRDVRAMKTNTGARQDLSPCEPQGHVMGFLQRGKTQAQRGQAPARAAEGPCSPREVGGTGRQCPSPPKKKEAFKHLYVSRELASPGKPLP